ncbi:MAG: tetratricopeptide repeat protein [Ruminococcus sp.]|nr:tetratricopeptide repeat protein [Ruminococcus sp.]
MAYDEIYNELKEKMTDDKAANEAMLKKEFERFLNERNDNGTNAAAKLIMENMPEDMRDEILRITHIDGIGLEEYYGKIDKLIDEHNINEAKILAEKLYKKIILDFKETEKEKFVSFRNPFEDNLCQTLFKSEKTLTRTPFDFPKFITTYAYILTEAGSPYDAIPVLQKAMEYNPVDCGPKFELAEVYKKLRNKKRLIELTIETLRVASSPQAIARCYANMGYILTDFGEFDDAVAFYTASAMADPNPAIPREMQHLADLKGSPIQYVGREKIKEVLEKYDMTFGPNQEVVNVAAQLAAYYLGQKNIKYALNAMKITYGLTRDQELRKVILKYEGVVFPEDTKKPDITQTVNENPEE